MPPCICMLTTRLFLAPLYIHACAAAVCWMGDDEGAPVSPLALSAGAEAQRKVGRELNTP